MSGAATFIVRGLFASVTLFLVFINYWVAPQQDSRIGFAARNREPDELAFVVSIMGIVIGLGLFLWIIIKKRLPHQLVAIAGLTILTAYTYLASW